MGRDNQAAVTEPHELLICGGTSSLGIQMQIHMYTTEGNDNNNKKINDLMQIHTP
jgi:hypothetical protein